MQWVFYFIRSGNQSVFPGLDYRKLAIGQWFREEIMVDHYFSSTVYILSYYMLLGIKP